MCSIETYDNKRSSVTDTTMSEGVVGSDRVTQVRNQVVDDLIAEGTIVSAPVEAAMRKVPRELFAPGVNLEEVYHRYNGVITKWDGREFGQLGVHAFGPDAAELAEEVAEQLRVWEREHRGGPGPQFRVYPAGTPDDQLPEGRVIDKKHTRVTISWPQAATAAAGQSVLPHPTD